MLIVSAHDGYPRWVDSGADFIEVDVRRTREGVLVLSHDEIRPGARHVTFEEVLERTAGRVGLQLDLKEQGYEVDIVAMALRTCAAERLVVTTGVDEALRRVRARFPAVRTGLTRAHVEATDADFIALDHAYATDEALEFCDRRGIALWLWTVDDEAAIVRFANDPRVAALITNRPHIALKLRSARS